MPRGEFCDAPRLASGGGVATLSPTLRRGLALLRARLGDAALAFPILRDRLLFVFAGVVGRQLLKRISDAVLRVDAPLAASVLRIGARRRLRLRLRLPLRLCLWFALTPAAAFLLYVDGLVALGAVADRDDLRTGEVLDDVQQFADRLRHLDRRIPVLPPLRSGEDGRLPPAADLFDDRVAEGQDRLGRQLLPRLYYSAVLKHPTVRDHALALRVVEDVGDAHAVLVVVVATVERADGAIGPLGGHGLRMQHAVEEADDPGSTAGNAELAVSGVDAAGGRHGHAEVVGAGLRGVLLRLHDAIGLDRLEELLRHVAPVHRHRVEVVLLSVALRPEVLRHERHRIGAAAHTRGAWRLVDVDYHRPHAGGAEPARREHPRGASVGARARVPELLRRVGKPVRLRALEQHLLPILDGLAQHVAHVGSRRKLGVVNHVLVIQAEGVLRLVLRKDEVQNMLLDLGVVLCLVIQLLLGDAQVLQRAVVVEKVGLQPATRVRAVVEQMVHPEALPLRLGGVHRPHAHDRGLVRSLPTVHQVQQLVVRADNVHVADEEPVLVVDRVPGQLRYFLLHEGDGVHDALRADGVALTWRQHPAGAQVESVLRSGGPDHRVPRILAAVHAGDDLDGGMHGDGINRLALAFVAEEAACDHQHVRALDQGVQHRLLGGLHKFCCGFVAQLGDGFQILQLGVSCLPRLDQLGALVAAVKQPA
mmetsp:Transcript_23029/g.66090  ORF Transcript_23029/g.66090 Transcript_23029/m.66090 type:complete len:705 (-) Transcript_23029:256-2370(-)